MDKFTKEQQVQAVYDLKVGYTLGHADIAMLKSMARQLLASMEQEPMAWVTMQKEFCDDERTAITNQVDADRYSISCYDLTPLYAAPQLPQPAVVMMTFDEWSRKCELQLELCDSGLREKARYIWDEACRAAMLQGADCKPELTAWYGAMPETNGKTNWTAILHRKGECLSTGITIDRSEYPDRVRYEADRMRHLIGELADEPDILAYDAEAHSGYVYPGNSPVIPDTWIPVSERMPNDKDVVWCYGYVSGWTDSDGFEAYYDATRIKWWTVDGETVRKITHWMPLPAAPQQEYL